MRKFKIGVHGPLIMGIQHVLGFTGDDIDGFHGKNTNRRLVDYQEANSLDSTGVVDKKTLRKMSKFIPLRYKVFNLISEFEGANSWKNAWAYKSIVKGDGAGWNYGILQHNRLGSLQILRKEYGFKNPPSAWFGSPAGARAQYKYFITYIYNPSVRNAKLMGDTSDRAICMLCDARTQGGGFYPSKPPRSWRDWKLDPKWVKVAKELYRDHRVSSAFLALINRHECPAKMFAELYPRSGNPRYLDDQLSRRRTVIYGHGVVHGSDINMEDFLL